MSITILESSFKGIRSRNNLLQVRQAVAQAVGTLGDSLVGQPNTPAGRELMMKAVEHRLKKELESGRIESYEIKGDSVTYTRGVAPIMSKDTTGALSADEMDVQIDDEEEPKPKLRSIVATKDIQFEKEWPSKSKEEEQHG